MTHTCPDCYQARARLWHGYRAGCEGCKARALARDPVFAAAMQAGRITADYERALRFVAGEGWREMHEQAKAWAAAARPATAPHQEAA